jgi:single-strand DNA-binding protein
MAGSVNKVILVGNLGADPEVKSFQNGGPHRQSAHRHQRKLEGPRHRRAQGTHRMAQVVIKSDGLVGVAERFLRKGSKSTSKASCAPASGRTRAAMTAIPPKISVGVGGVLTMLDGPQGGGGGGGQRSGGVAAARAAV